MKKLYTCLLFSFLLLLPETSLSQNGNFIVSGVDATKYPLISASFVATDGDGKPRTGMQSSNFEVFENGTEIKPELVKMRCENPELNPEVSVLLVIDISSSMDPTASNGYQDRMDWIKFAAKTFIDSLKFYKRTTVALSTFSSSAKLKVDFTNNTTILKDSIDKLKAGGATYYNHAFLHPVDGVINAFKSRSDSIKKIVIFMTDGDPTDAADLERDQIIDSLKYYNIQGYTIGLGETVSSGFLQLIAFETGGKYFSAKTKEELTGIYRLLALENQIKQTCYLEWISGASCSDLDRIRNVKINFVPLAKTENEMYTAPANSIAELVSSEPILSYGSTDIGVASTQSVTFKASRSDFEIQDIRISPGDYFFLESVSGAIDQKPPYKTPMILKKGDSITVQIAFIQKDKKVFRQAELIIIGLPCSKIVDLAGGVSQVRLVSPNSATTGAFSSICDTINITWTGVAKTDPVNLYYTTDTGSSLQWINIAKDVKGFMYKWIAPSAHKSYRFKVEVSPMKSWHWSRLFGSKVGNDQGTSIAVTRDRRYVYIAGYFEDVIDFTTETGTGRLTSAGKQDIFVAKYDSEGRLLWAKRAGGAPRPGIGKLAPRPGNDVALALTVDTANNVYVTGYQEAGSSFGTNIFTYGREGDQHNFFIAKYESETGEPELISYGMGQGTGTTDKLNLKYATSRGTNILYSIENNIEYLYVQLEYWDMLRAVPSWISGADYIGARGQSGTRVMRIPLANPTNGKYFASLPSGLEWRTNLKQAIDSNQNEYYTGSFKSVYSQPGIPPLLTSDITSDVFISKLIFFPGSSDSSRNSLEIVSPTIVFSQPNDNAGSIAVGQTNEIVLKAFVTNSGPVDIFLEDASFVGTHSSEFIVKFTDGKILKAGETLKFEILFRPAAVGERKADLVVKGSCGSLATVAVTGFGLTPCNTTAHEFINFSVSSLNITKTVSDVACLLKYEGLGPKTFKPVIKGANKENFTLRSLIPQPDADGFITLESGSCFTAVVNFTPDLVQKYSAYIDYEGLEECEAPQTALIGEGLRPSLFIESKDWGIRRLGTKWTGTIYLRNNDSITAVINDIRPKNQSADFSYAISQSTPFTQGMILKPAEYIQIDVAFTPQSNGPLSLDIEAHIESFKDPIIGTLSGIGALPVISTTDTSFRAVLVGTQSSEVIENYIANLSSDTSLFIESIRIIRNDGDDFSLSGFALPASNFNIIKNGRINNPIIVQFRPSEAGLRTLQLEVISDAAPGTEDNPDPRMVRIVTITGVGLDFTKTDITPFKNYLTCETPSQIITFYNSSETPVFVTGFTPVNGETSNFSFSPVTFEVGADTTQDVMITFMPGLAGSYDAEFKIENSFGKDMRIIAEGEAKNSELTLSIEPIKSASPGDFIEIPVKISTNDLYSYAITNIELTIALDKNLLGFKNVTGAQGWSFEVDDTDRNRLRITGSGPALSSNQNLAEFLKLGFDVYLSKPSSTAVEIKEINAGAECIIPISQNSDFALGGVCFIDGRAVSINSDDFLLSSVSPNPVRENAKIFFGVGLDGRTTITLFNSSGVKIVDIVDGDFKSGLYEAALPTESLPAGVYYYTMYSGPFTETKKLVIVK
jgi:Mg-chelatase subunit ChlD